jgi:hypothetical protein
MVNPHRGEVALEIDGETRVLRLSLGALAELEASLETGSLLELVERFESGRFRAHDLIALLAAGLKGAGEAVPDLAAAEIAGGAAGAAKAAARLLALSFGGADG